MNEQTTKFLNLQIHALSTELYEFNNKKSEALGKLNCLAGTRRRLYRTCKDLLEMVEANPEVDFSDQEHAINTAKWFAHDYEDEDKRSPTEVLLSWSANGEVPFISNQLYDLIGKEDARTFRALLREVVLPTPVKVYEMSVSTVSGILIVSCNLYSFR